MASRGAQSIEANLAKINGVVKLFCGLVSEGSAGYISIEYRNGALKYFFNNDELGPGSRPRLHYGNKPKVQQALATDFSQPPPLCATPAAATTPPLTATPPVPPDEQPTASTPSQPSARVVTRGANKKRKAAISPEQLHVARTNLTPEIPRTAAATNSLHISQLSTENRDSSDNDALDVDDEDEEEE